MPKDKDPEDPKDDLPRPPRGGDLSAEGPGSSVSKNRFMGENRARAEAGGRVDENVVEDRPEPRPTTPPAQSDEKEKGVKWWIRHVIVPVGVALIAAGLVKTTC